MSCLPRGYLAWGIVVLACALVVPAWAESATDSTADTATKEDTAKKDAAKESDAKDKTPADKADKADKADEEKEKKSADDSEKHTVKREPFKIEVSFSGTFEAQAMTELAVRLEEWSGLEVVRAVPHGALVKRGDVLVQFDLEKIDQQIADLKTDAQLADLDLQESEEGLRTLQAATPMELADAARAKRIADEDLARYLQVDRDVDKKSVDYMLKMSQDSLDYEKEELRQLEKMYKADDLVEETEEIILKRQRDAVAFAEFQFSVAKLRHEWALKATLPREDEKVQQDTRRVDLLSEKIKILLPVALRRAELDLQKKRVDRARQAEKLKKLLADREALTVTAPADGLVYYGQWVRGKWSGSTSVAEKLRRGGSVSVNDVFMTLLQTRPMIVRFTVPEKDFRWIKADLKGAVEPTAFPQLRLPGTVSQVASVPFGDGEFEGRLKVSLDQRSAAVMPGMGCTVKFMPYVNAKALTIPAKALFDDDLDPSKHYVYLVPKDGKARKQPVTLGEKTDEKVEIVKGLSEGDQVLLEKPKDEK